MIFVSNTKLSLPFSYNFFMGYVCFLATGRFLLLIIVQFYFGLCIKYDLEGCFFFNVIWFWQMLVSMSC